MVRNYILTKKTIKIVENYLIYDINYLHGLTKNNKNLTEISDVSNIVGTEISTIQCLSKFIHSGSKQLSKLSWIWLKIMIKDWTIYGYDFGQIAHKDFVKELRK